MDLSQLPADLWTTRLPASLLDRAPHVEERDGQAVWVCDGKVWGRWDGKPPATGSARPIKALYNAFDRAGIHDPSARRPAVAELRLADMDRDGVAAQVIFGPIFQISTDDPVLRTACYRVYNDWLLDFCKAAPDRLIGLPMLPETPEGAPAELERVRAEGGVRQVNLMIANINPKLDDAAWEPLWQALEDSGIILSWHITVFVGRPGDLAIRMVVRLQANDCGQCLEDEDRQKGARVRDLGCQTRTPAASGADGTTPGFVPAHGEAQGGHACELEAGQEVVIAPAVSDAEAKQTYPGGWKPPKPYIRIVLQPK